MSIKKSFVEIHDLLSSNEDVLVSDIMPQLLEIMTSKQRDTNHRTNENDELEVFCYYHKQWENTTKVEYGKKANTATGLNSMCKIGTNQWTKQQREFKKFKSELLDKVVSGELASEDLQDEIAKLEEEKDRIIPLAS